jgi:WD40 repeat protein
MSQPGRGKLWLGVLLGIGGTLAAAGYYGPRYLREQKQHETDLAQLRQRRAFVELARQHLGRGDHAAALWQLDQAYAAGLADDNIRFLIPQLQARVQEQLATLPHDGEVLAVSFSADGKTALTVSADKTARLWDATTGALRFRLDGHDGAVVQGSFSADGARVLTLSSDGSARLWDAQTGKSVATLRDPAGQLWFAVFAGGGTRVVTVASSSTARGARLWDAQTGQLLGPLPGHEAPVRQVSVSQTGQRLLTASEQLVQLWDAQTGKLVAALRGHSGTIKDAVLTADGKRVVTSSADTTAKLWDGQTGQLVATMEGHTGTVYSASFTLAGGKAAMTISADGTARMWDRETGQPMFLPVGHPRHSQILSMSQDSSRMVIVNEGGTLELWDRILGHMRAQLVGHSGEVLTTAFSPYGRRIATGGIDGTVRIWDARSGQPLHKLRGHYGRVQTVTFSPDGQRVLTGSTDNTARLFRSFSDGFPRPLMGHASEVASVQFSPDGRRALSSSKDGTVRVWEVQTGDELTTLAGHRGPVQSVQFVKTPVPLPPGVAGEPKTVERIVTVDPGRVGSGGRIPSYVRIYDGTTYALWSVLGGDLDFGRTLAVRGDGLRVLSATEDGQGLLWQPQAEPAAPQRVAQLTGHQGPLTAAAWSRDGSLLVTASEDGTVRLWDGQTGAAKGAPLSNPGPVRALAVAPGATAGSWVIAGSGGDRAVRIWDAATGQLRGTLDGHVGEVRAIRFSPDGSRLLCIDAGERAWLWDPRSSQMVAALEKYSGRGYVALDFSSDGSRIATGGDELRIWDGHSGHLLLSLDDNQRAEVLTALSFSEDGSLLISGTLNGPVKLWDLHLEQRPALEVHRDLSHSPAFLKAANESALAPTAAEPGKIPSQFPPEGFRQLR